MNLDEVLIRYIKSLPFEISGNINVDSYKKLERLAVARAHHHLEEFLINNSINIETSKVSYSSFKWKFSDESTLDIASPDGIGKFLTESGKIFAVYEFKNGSTGKRSWRQIVTYALLGLYFNLNKKRRVYIIGITIGNQGKTITNGILIITFKKYSSIILNFSQKNKYRFYIIKNECLRKNITCFLRGSYRGSIRKILMESFPQLYLIDERRAVPKNSCIFEYDSL